MGYNGSSMEHIYLDHNATTPVAPQVVEAMLPYLTASYGNASSVHHFGQQARTGVERARDQVAQLLNCRPAEIIFTSGGTEADNLAIFGAVGSSTKPRKHVVTTAIEHHAVLHACGALEKEGVEVTCVPVGPSGVVDPDEVARAIRPETVLVSVMLANNELGTIQPVAEIARRAHERGVLVHSDGVQAAGKIPVDVRALDVDLLSISAHKIYGPKGAGALFVRRNTPLKPTSYGGGHERNLRAGTENVPGIVGLGRAAELAQATLADEASRLAGMRDRLERGILEAVEEAGRNGDPERRVPNTTNLHFGHVEGEALVIALDLKGVCCATGAACSSGAVEPSHVLTAIGLRPDLARSSLRFSLGRQNTEAHVDRILEVLPSVVARLRQLSPV